MAISGVAVGKAGRNAVWSFLWLMLPLLIAGKVGVVAAEHGGGDAQTEVSPHFDDDCVT